MEKKNDKFKYPVLHFFFPRENEFLNSDFLQNVCLKINK